MYDNNDNNNDDNNNDNDNDDDDNRGRRASPIRPRLPGNSPRMKRNT